jgi:hypothetical protein
MYARVYALLTGLNNPTEQDGPPTAPPITVAPTVPATATPTGTLIFPSASSLLLQSTLITLCIQFSSASSPVLFDADHTV